MRVAVLFDNCGPYHLARLRAATKIVECLGIQYQGMSADYAWGVSNEAAAGLPLATMFDHGHRNCISSLQIRDRLTELLKSFAPEALFVPGWSGRLAFSATEWATSNGVPVVLMSESSERDQRRSMAGEWVKSRYINAASAFFVGGIRHSEYLQELGAPLTKIFLGYDAVDNGYFESQAAACRESTSGEQRGCPYFLASARFIAKKNLPFLVQSYARYRDMVQGQNAWKLVILGDGEMRRELESLVHDLAIHHEVSFPGFMQYEDLPRYYAGAGAFVHASSSEQWGLVVNEAMASGLPALVSKACGCVPELVHDGVNGWTFNPENVEELAGLMHRLTGKDEAARAAMGVQSQHIVAAWGVERFAAGVRAAAQCAIEAGPRIGGAVDRLVIRILATR